MPIHISAMDVEVIPFKLNSITEHALPLKLSTELPGVKVAAGDKMMYASTKEEYKEKILDLYKNEELRFKMGKEGRWLVEENYNWRRIVEEMERILIAGREFV